MSVVQNLLTIALNDYLVVIHHVYVLFLKNLSHWAKQVIAYVLKYVKRIKRKTLSNILYSLVWIPLSYIVIK